MQSGAWDPFVGVWCPHGSSLACPIEVAGAKAVERNRFVRCRGAVHGCARGGRRRSGGGADRWTAVHTPDTMAAIQQRLNAAAQAMSGIVEMIGVEFTTREPKKNGCRKLDRQTCARIQACEEKSEWSKYS